MESFVGPFPGDNWRERGYAGVVFGPADLCIRTLRCKGHD